MKWACDLLFELLFDLLCRNIKTLQVPLGPHEEDLSFLVHMLIDFQDIAVVIRQKAGYGGNEPLAVGTVDEQNSGVIFKVVQWL